MPAERTSGKPTTRRYSTEEKERAVRLVRQLRAELGTRAQFADRSLPDVALVRGRLRRKPCSAVDRVGPESPPGALVARS